MSTANIRTASYALNQARPIVARLDAARNPEDVAADIIEAWTAAETALRALAGGSSAGGQALIKDLRTREILSLEQGHALLGFLGARDRVVRTDYRPTSADVQAAREGFQRLESAVAAGGAVHAAPDLGASPAAATVPSPSLETPTGGWSTGSARARRGFPVIPVVLGVVLLALVGGLAYWWLEVKDGPSALRNGIAAYRDGRSNEARTHFTSVARNHPDLATPHVFLARMARDEGNLPGALSELQTAVRLEPNNALALREMGAYLYTVGNYDLARRFYVRTLQVSPNDKEAQGFLGCSLVKLGRPAEAQRFLQRAGQGSWSICAQQLGGQVPMQPGVAGPYPQGQVPPGAYPQPQYPQPQYPAPRQ